MLLMENDEKRRATQETSRQAREDVWRVEEHMFDRWTKTSKLIKEMRLAIGTDSRIDILENIEQLVKRKKKFAIELGME